MRVLLVGSNGQIGWELQRALAWVGEIQAADRSLLDLHDVSAIRRRVREYKPNVIVNAAAYTSVDLAETEQEEAFAINAVAPGVLAEEALLLNASLIHYSTDYVFDGRKPSNYSEEDLPNPLNTYGKSKLRGEQLIEQVGGRYVIFRTSWVYGLRGRNFYQTICRLAKSKQEIAVVEDQIGAPTWSRLIADVSALFLHNATRANWISPYCGRFNLSCSGAVSWCDFARAIIVESCLSSETRDVKVLPIPSSEFPSPAVRPKNSRLDASKIESLLKIRLPNWRDALRLCTAERLST